MAKTLTKKDLKTPDSFQAIAGQGAKWVEDNVKVIVGLVVAIVGACALWLGYGFYENRQELMAEKALFPAQDSALKNILASNEANAIQLNGYLGTLKEHSGKKAAAASAIQVISALNSKENTESLQKQVVEAAQFSPSQNHVLYGLWYLSKGQVLGRNGEIADAKKSFQQVLESAKQKELHPTALIQLGALAEKEGDFQGAKDFYSRVSREFPGTEAQRMADKLLIHIDLLGTSGNTKGS